MPGFSTLALGGTIVSPLRLNYDLTISGNTTVALAYSNASITDIVGLQVVIYNSSSSAITLTAGSQFDNYTSYPNYCSVINQVVVPAFQTITLITTVVGQDYTIESISGKVSIDKGAAGNIVYQTAANRTGFLAAGTPNYVLQSGGPGQPPTWNLLSIGNLAGGVAGSLVYQSAPDTTSKSAVGTAFSNGGGGIASMASSTTCGWNNVGYQGGLGQSTYSGGVITWKSSRNYTFTLASFGTSTTLAAILSAVGVTRLDGDTYTLYNDGGSPITINVGTVINASSWSPSFTTGTAGSQTIYLYANETVKIQVFNASNVSIEYTSQSQNFIGSYTVAGSTSSTSGAWYPLIGSLINDPNNWSSVGSRTITPKVPGNYIVYIYLNQGNAGSTIPVLDIFKNQTTTGGSGSTLIISNTMKSGSTTGNATWYATASAFMNGSTDYFAFQTNTTGSANWISGQIQVILLT